MKLGRELGPDFNSNAMIKNCNLVLQASVVIQESNKNLNFPPHQVISGCHLSLLLSSSSPLPFSPSFLLPFNYTQNAHNSVEDRVPRQTSGQDTTQEAAPVLKDFQGEAKQRHMPTPIPQEATRQIKRYNHSSLRTKALLPFLPPAKHTKNAGHCSCTHH